MDNKKVGERLLRLRQEEKLSQADFAKRLGASPGAYQHYERGEREIPSSLLWALKEEFDVDPLWMMAPESADDARPRMRPTQDMKLLADVGMAVETAIAEYGKPLTLPKKWEIIAFLYGHCAREGKMDRSLLSTVVSGGGSENG